MAKILLIDDSNFILDITRKFLESEGHEVVGVARDGEDGVDAFRYYAPDLALLDITMPNMDGRDCLRKILEINPDARVIVASALHERTIVDLCLRLGAKCYVEKPMKFRDFAFCEGFRQAIASALAA